MMTIKQVLLIQLLLLSVANFVHADSDGENAKLAQISHELDALLPLIKDAQAQSNKDDRIQFQYDWLLLDVKRIKSAVQEHITAPRTQARSFPPLKGDYRH